MAEQSRPKNPAPRRLPRRMGLQMRFYVLLGTCLCGLLLSALLAQSGLEGELTADETRLRMLGVGLGTALLGAWLIGLLTRGFRQAIEELYQGLDQINDLHDWDLRLPVHGEDEFSRVADRLNYLFENMAQMDLRIRSKTFTLKETNKQLVEEVEARRRMERQLEEKTEHQARLIERLEAAQNQLIQAEKLASIGQLAAGVAHEINNPIGFVNSNLGALQDYTAKLFGALDAYRALDAVTAEQHREIVERFDLAYLGEDLPVLLQESSEGIERVKKIVQDLKDFSHVDSGEWVAVDLNRSIDSTLNIVRNEIKYKAEVERDYAELPRIKVLGSQLNQVVLNLLVNAAHAIEKFGRIVVRTRRDADNVYIEIRDDGCGIPAENLTRIFDPFFTTKPVGTGTGLGLSLAFGIMKRMHGDISVDSEVGRGSCFTLRIPIAAAELDQAAEPVPS
ncbi:ATP-binding protein [Chitinimonas koreensis]|uniref:ATP-binding protein n=1 Tax=Chitinimonas koreensis TaxID=356302 RepID=UPI001FE1AA8B|nr:ATP-binding protein [Chitinimonas koreensis]